jgi:hypothetical protein
LLVKLIEAVRRGEDAAVGVLLLASPGRSAIGSLSKYLSDDSAAVVSATIRLLARAESGDYRRVLELVEPYRADSRKIVARDAEQCVRKMMDALRAGEATRRIRIGVGRRRRRNQKTD